MKLSDEQLQHARDVYNVEYETDDWLETIDDLKAQLADKAYWLDYWRARCDKKVAELATAEERATGAALILADGESEKFGLELLNSGDKHGWSLMDDLGHRLRDLAPRAVLASRIKEKKAVLAEAEWWEHLVGAVHHQEGREECEPDCMYCERMGTLRSELSAMESELIGQRDEMRKR